MTGTEKRKVTAFNLGEALALASMNQAKEAAKANEDTNDSTVVRSATFEYLCFYLAVLDHVLDLEIKDPAQRAEITTGIEQVLRDTFEWPVAGPAFQARARTYAEVRRAPNSQWGIAGAASDVLVQTLVGHPSIHKWYRAHMCWYAQFETLDTLIDTIELVRADDQPSRAHTSVPNRFSEPTRAQLLTLRFVKVALYVLGAALIFGMTKLWGRLGFSVSGPMVLYGL